MAPDVFPFDPWLEGMKQASVIVNDIALKVELISAPAIAIESTQPGSPSDNDQYILGAAPSGAQWDDFAEDNVVIFKGGTWYAFAPYDGWLKFNADDGDTYQFTTSGGWTVFAGGGGGGGMSNPMTTAADLIVGGVSGAPARLAKGTAYQQLRMNSGATAQEWANDVQCIPIACSDESTALTTGTAKVTFRMPYAFKLTDIRASVTTAPTGGTLLTVDVNEAGSTILSTKLTFDASEKTTTTAATPRVISDSDLADDAEMTIDIDAVGSTIAGAGLKVYLIGYKAS